ncbi:GNAT family N-acetyltransferase [Luteimonas padinae]|uniref:GNAT family N-acetyltransferase n=1 Tax=Luteimonas padinae TaxID=1714359 RepID=A0ABV6STJ6_9GAMM
MSLEVEHRKLTRSFTGKSFPYTYLALVDGQLIGAAQLKLQEMKEFPALAHWLGNVYVVASARGTGVAQALVSHVAAEAQDHGIEKLYLQTEDLSGGLYSRCGWTALTHTQSHGKEVLIMERRLGPNNSFKPNPLRGSA